MPGYVCTSLSPFHRPTYVTDIPLEASDPWLGTRTGDGGTVILIQGCFSLFFGRSAWPMCTKCDNTKCLLFLVFPPWRAVWSYSPHLEVRYPIWGDDCSHSLHQTVFYLMFSGLSSVQSKCHEICVQSPALSHHHSYN